MRPFVRGASVAGRVVATLPMPHLTPLFSIRSPLGGQEIELQQVVHDAGGMPFMRIRVRERARFTIFDVDPVTARRWAESMLRWADLQRDAKPGDAG